MFKKTFLVCALAGVLAASATAGTIVTQNNALTMTTPSDAWQEINDSKYWLSFSDGNNTIAVDRLDAKAAFPAFSSINEAFPVVAVDFYTTQDNNYVVKSLAKFQSDLAGLKQVVNGITINEASGAKTLKPAPVTYYVNSSDGLKVRSGASQDYDTVTVLPDGQSISVLGFITSQGARDGWARITYNNADGYVSTAFITTTPAKAQNTAVQTTAKQNQAQTQPQTQPQTQTQPQAQTNQDNSDYVKCPVCGMMLKQGTDYRSHMMSAHPDYTYPEDEDYIECPVCGMMLKQGTDYRSHMMSAHPNYDINADTDYILCEYCNQYIPSASYIDHMYENHRNETEESVACPYCGEYFLISELQDHVTNYHGADIDSSTSIDYIECPYCGEYILEAKMQDHLATHGEYYDYNTNTDNYYTCAYCGAVFYDIDEFVAHSCPAIELNETLNGLDYDTDDEPDYDE